jgi:hypothetical protein
MEAIHASETLVHFDETTWRYIPEYYKLCGEKVAK